MPPVDRIIPGGKSDFKEIVVLFFEDTVKPVDDFVFVQLDSPDLKQKEAGQGIMKPPESCGAESLYVENGIGEKSAGHMCERLPSGNSFGTYRSPYTSPAVLPLVHR